MLLDLMNFSQPDEHTLIIKDRPLFYWLFIVLADIVIGGIISILVMDTINSEKWLYAVIGVVVMGLIVLGQLLKNNKFSISSVVDQKAEKLIFKTVGLFGKQKKEFVFSEITKLEINTKYWGRTDSSSYQFHARHSLTLKSSDDLVNLVYSTGDETIFQLHKILQKMIEGSSVTEE